MTAVPTLIDLSYWGVLREPVPRGRTASGAVWAPQPWSLDASRLFTAQVSAQVVPGRTLVVVDDPERIPAAGLLYADTLSGHVRVWAYGVNAAGTPLALGVGVLASLGPITVGIERLGAAAGSSNGPYQVSALAAARWMATNYVAAEQSAPLINTVRVGSGAFAELTSVQILPVAQGPGAPGQVGNVILDFQLTGEAVVLVYARPASIVAPTTPPTTLLPAVHSPVLRGTFPVADVALTAVAPLDSYLLLPAPQLTPFSGTSAVDHTDTQNPGFGTRWTVQLTAQAGRAALPQPDYATVALGPATRYGVETTVWWSQGSMSTIEDVYAPPPYARDIHTGYAVEVGTVPLGQSATLDWLGTGGIGYPIAVFVLTPQTRTGQILNALGVAGATLLAGLAGYTAGANA